MGDIYFPKKARKHMKEYEYMSSYWFVRGYPEYKDILSAPETPERRKALMKLKIDGIDQALKIIPEDIRGMILDSIIHRADFNRLVNYVKENNINENITAKEVREAYIEWIKYLLDWHNDGSAAQPDRNKNM